MRSMKICEIRATTVTVPLRSVLLHSNGAHWGRFVRTIVEVETDEGIVGYGELGGGGESTEIAVQGLNQYLVGHDPFQLEELRFKICNPTASLYNNRTQIHGAIEFACLDIIGKKLQIPVYQLLGGKLRDRIPFASYLFFSLPIAGTDQEEVRNIDQLIAHCKKLKEEYGFTTHKLKGGVFHPEYELQCYIALASTFPNDRVRYDPNAVLTVEDAIRFGEAIQGLKNDYFEDPTWGLNGLRRVRSNVKIPIATNTVVVNFEQLATNILNPAVDVVLLDTTFWGGVRACLKAATICEAFQLGVSIHSSGELGIQLATMLHLAAALPNLSFAADSHYHHLADDVLKGGKFRYENGCIRVPEGPGLGIELDGEKVREYAQLYKELGGYPYDRDPSRPGWFALVPNNRWASHL